MWSKRLPVTQPSPIYQTHDIPKPATRRMRCGSIFFLFINRLRGGPYLFSAACPATRPWPANHRSGAVWPATIGHRPAAVTAAAWLWYRSDPRRRCLRRRRRWWRPASRTWLARGPTIHDDDGGGGGDRNVIDSGKFYIIRSEGTHA